jgi:hypothetical protein
MKRRTCGARIKVFIDKQVDEREKKVLVFPVEGHRFPNALSFEASPIPARTISFRPRMHASGYGISPPRKPVGQGEMGLRADDGSDYDDCGVTGLSLSRKRGLGTWAWAGGFCGRTR